MEQEKKKKTKDQSPNKRPHRKSAECTMESPKKRKHET
jgi:hypothetical protein